MENGLFLLAVLQGESMVDVKASTAYDSFKRGLLISDTSPNAELLERFALENKDEFYGDIMGRSEDGKFRFIEVSGEMIYFTYHRHAVIEAVMPQLQEFERIADKQMTERYRVEE